MQCFEYESGWFCIDLALLDPDTDLYQECGTSSKCKEIDKN
jgi:hypothetical protein